MLPKFNNICLHFIRLLQENICTEKNIPSISSINRIIRDRAMSRNKAYEASNGSDEEVGKLAMVVMKRLGMISEKPISGNY